MRHFFFFALCVSLMLCAPLCVRAIPPEATAQYQVGKDFFNGGKNAEAIAVYDAVIKLDPTFAEAYIDRGNAYLILKKWDEAFIDYNQGIKLAEPMPSPERERILARAYTNRGQVYRHKQEWEHAVADYTQGIVFDPSKSLPWEGRAIAYQELNQIDKSEADLRKFAEVRGDTEASYLDLAQKAYDESDFNTAFLYVYRAIVLNSRSDRAYALRGEVRLNSDLTRASQDYKKALEINPKNANALAGLGEIEIQNGHEKPAKKYLEDALKVDPKLPVAWIRLGNYALKFESGDDRIKHALANFTKAIEINPQLSVGYYNRGRVYQADLLDYDQALSEYAKALEYNPKDKQSLNNRGLIYKKHGQYDLAVADLKRATEIDPNYGDAFFNLAAVYRRQGDLPKAVTAIGNARKTAPKDDEMLRYMFGLFKDMNIDPYQFLSKGVDLYDKQDYEGSIVQYRKTLEYDPVSRDGLFNIALSLDQMNKYKEAREQCLEVLRYYPDDTKVYFEYAELSAYDQNWNDAIPYYQKVIELDPNYAGAHRGLANAYRGLKDYDKAWPLYAKEIELHPDSVGSYLNRGQAYLSTHQWELAYIDYTKAINMDAKSYLALAIVKRSVVYYQMGNYEKAVSEYQRGKALDPTWLDLTFTREEAARNKENWDTRVHPAEWANVVP